MWEWNVHGNPVRHSNTQEKKNTTAALTEYNGCLINFFIAMLASIQVILSFFAAGVH